MTNETSPCLRTASSFIKKFENRSVGGVKISAE